MLKVTCPAAYLPEREYVLRVVLGEWLGLEYIAESGDVRSTHITRAGDVSGARVEVDDSLFATPEAEWLRPASLPQSIRSWRPDSVTGLPVQAVLYGNEVARSTYLTTEGGVTRLGVDVFGAAFFLLTRYEEIINPERDDFERFAARSSVLHPAGLLERPVLNEHLELLWAALVRTWPRLARKSRAYRCLLSCDVDNVDIMGSDPAIALRILVGRSVRDAMRHGPWHSAMHRASRFWAGWRGVPGADALDDFDFLMDVAEKAGCRFVFNFIARKPGNSGKDGIYGLHRPGMRRLMRRIRERDHEVGFHGSYDSFRDPQQIRREFAHLNEVAAQEGVRQGEWGGRQHYLRWEAPTTWQGYEEAGLAYDSSLTYADHAGFRCGTCYEFPVFNVRTRQPLKLRERPLVVMEGSLLGDHYMKLNPQQAAEKVTTLADTCRRFDGDFTFLWHNGQSQFPAKRALFVDCTSRATVGRPQQAFAAV